MGQAHRCIDMAPYFKTSFITLTMATVWKKAKGIFHTVLDLGPAGVDRVPVSVSE